ncbi:MAG: hypothetical protein DMF61_26795 [Blastocatellia bacterium AA13]|nr:MAG: hypothetical protein DMF61_26795 [Blastocatellia bacterium AA13]
MALGNQEHLAYLKEENQAVRSNLRNVLESSSCNLEDLSRYVEGFNCPTNQNREPGSWGPAALKEAAPEKLAERLGKIEFGAVGWGVM